MCDPIPHHTRTDQTRQKQSLQNCISISRNRRTTSYFDARLFLCAQDASVSSEMFRKFQEMIVIPDWFRYNFYVLSIRTQQDEKYVANMGCSLAGRLRECGAAWRKPKQLRDVAALLAPVVAGS